MSYRLALILFATSFSGLSACGDDANDEHIGGECDSKGDCENEELTCLTEFKGGYCGAKDCEGDDDCLDGSICVTHEGTNYCFLVCLEKEECNDNRESDNESNCSSNIDRVDGGNDKACVPPSAG